MRPEEVRPAASSACVALEWCGLVPRRARGRARDGSNCDAEAAGYRRACVRAQDLVVCGGDAWPRPLAQRTRGAVRRAGGGAGRRPKARRRRRAAAPQSRRRRWLQPALHAGAAEAPGGLPNTPLCIVADARGLGPINMSALVTGR
jgi:hypothetical protein